MNILIFLFKSGLPFEEIAKTSEEKADQYKKVPGLIQKYYVQDKSSERVGGVFVFDSIENLQAFKDSDLAKSTAEVYKFLDPPHTQVLKIAKVLHET